MNPLCIVALLVLLAASCVERTTGYRWPGLDDPDQVMRDLGCGCDRPTTEIPPDPPRPPELPTDPTVPIDPTDGADVDVPVVR